MTEKEDALQPTEVSDASAQTDSTVEYADLTAVIEEKDRLLAEADDRYIRLHADFDNFRRRARQEKEELSLVIAESVIAKLLPIIDNFERALAAGQTQDAAGILSGVEMIYRQFHAVLEKLDVKPIEAIGAQFDPKVHEAVMRVEDAGQPDGVIIEELQKGYLIKDKVIRPSMVKVVGN